MPSPRRPRDADVTTHTFTRRCVGDRSWGLFLPLYLAELRPGSVAPVAVIEVVRHGFGMLFATKVAEWCETQGHSKVLRRLLICENLGVVLGALLSRAALGDLGNPAFWAAAVFFGVDAVCSSALQTLVGKVAVRSLSSSIQATRLAETNARLVRLDMAVALSCPLVVGYLSKRHGGLRGLHCHDDDCHAHHFGAAAALAVSHVIGGVAVFICSGKFRACLSDSPPPSPRSVIPKSPSKLEGLNAVRKLDPFARGCLDCYCLLYFTVLSPHGVTVAWLRGVRRTDAAVIGLFQTLAQGAGLLATFFTPFVVERTGARKAARVSNAAQVVCAALSVFALYHGHEKVFLAGLCASRFGLWAFDLLEREILQTAARSDDQCMALFAEQSRRTSAASLLIFGASAYLSDAEKFPYLLGASLLTLVVSMLVLDRGARRADALAKRD